MIKRSICEQTWQSLCPRNGREIVAIEKDRSGQQASDVSNDDPARGRVQDSLYLVNDCAFRCTNPSLTSRPTLPQAGG